MDPFIKTSRFSNICILAEFRIVIAGGRNKIYEREY